MEEQLAAYRAKKAKERASQGTWLATLRNRFSGTRTSPDIKKMANSEKEDTTDIMSEDSDNLLSGKVNANMTESRLLPGLNIENALKLLLWLLSLGAFLFIGLGGVFLLVSAIGLLYLTMGTRKREEGELSAYSVFNPNCERIHGQLTAEQLEGQLVFGGI